MESIVFTPASLIDLLSQIEELNDCAIGISETIDGKIQLNVGKSSYIIDTDTATDVLVDEQTVEQVEDTNFEAYESLDDSTAGKVTITYEAQAQDVTIFLKISGGE